MIPATYGVIAATASSHGDETTREGLGIGRRDVVNYRLGERL